MTNIELIISELVNRIPSDYLIKYYDKKAFKFVFISADTLDTTNQQLISSINESDPISIRVFRKVSIETSEENLSKIKLDAKQSTYQSSFDQVYRTLMFDPINSRVVDRSGIFFDFPFPTIPKDTYTNKTYNEIIDQTAELYRYKNPVVSWSGGIDSTVPIAAFIKNNIDFSVILNSENLAENPELYEYLLNNQETIDTDITGLEAIKGRLLVTGDVNDQLFPSVQHSFVPRTKGFKTYIKDTNKIDPFYQDKIADSLKYRSALDYFIQVHSMIYEVDSSVSTKLFNEYLVPKIQQFPITVKYAYQLKWYFRFIFKYTKNLNRVFKQAGAIKGEARPFFDTEDFQRWAITNVDYNYEHYSINFKTYKLPAKQYNFDVLKLDVLLTQHKRASKNGVF